MGYQFVHLRCYARKADKNGGSVHSVLGEATRDPEYSTHVETPQPPRLLYGIPLDELEALHDDVVARAHTHPKKGTPRKLRQDQKTLCTVISSYPESREAADSDAVKRWENLNIAFFRRRYGDNLKSVIVHVDEAHPNIHAYVLPDDSEVRAQALNPGVIAKTEYVAAHPAATTAERKAVNRAGDMAYKRAMREYQDDYWHAVGIPCGLTRLGPQKRRLSREKWKAEQRHAEIVAELRQVSEDITSEIDTTAASRDAAQEALSELQDATSAAIEAADVAEAKRNMARKELSKARLETRRQEKMAASTQRKAHLQATRIIASAKSEAAGYHRFGWKVGRLLFAIKKWVQRDAITELQESESAKKKEMEASFNKQRRELTRELDTEHAKKEALQHSFDGVRQILAERNAELNELRPSRTSEYSRRGMEL